MAPQVLLRRTRELLDRSRALRGHALNVLGRTRSLGERSQRLMDEAAASARMAHAATRRVCPECSSPLEWVERGTIGGATYDYFRWCLKGCGLYCYSRDAKKWVKLA